MKSICRNLAKTAWFWLFGRRAWGLKSEFYGSNFRVEGLVSGV